MGHSGPAAFSLTASWDSCECPRQGNRCLSTVKRQRMPCKWLRVSAAHMASQLRMFSLPKARVASSHMSFLLLLQS